MSGWVKIHRSILEWEWYGDINTKVLFLHLLLKANHRDKKWQGSTIKRGQLLTGRKALSIETGLTERMIRTSLEKLKTTNEIAIESSNKNSVITILNYDIYQDNDDLDQQIDQQATSKRPTSDQQTTTTKNVKNNKECKEDKYSLLESRKQKFALTLEPFSSVYPREMLVDFYRYWTEPNKSKTKFRQELEKTWDVARRLETWARRDQAKVIRIDAPKKSKFETNVETFSSLLMPE